MYEDIKAIITGYYYTPYDITNITKSKIELIASNSNALSLKKGKRPQMIIKVLLSSNKVKNFDIYPLIKDISPRKRITHKYCDKIFDIIANKDLMIQSDETVSSYISNMIKHAISILG